MRWVLSWLWGFRGGRAYGQIVSGDFHILKGVGLEQVLKDEEDLEKGDFLGKGSCLVVTLFCCFCFRGNS